MLPNAYFFSEETLAFTIPHTIIQNGANAAPTATPITNSNIFSPWHKNVH
jgi:hypothetical protein